MRYDMKVMIGVKVSRKLQWRNNAYLSFRVCVGMFLFCIAGPRAFGQSKTKIDSLEALLPGKSGAEWLDVSYQIATAQIMADSLLDAERLTDRGYNMSESIGDTIRMISFGRLYASALRRQGRMKESAGIYAKILPFVRRHSPPKDIFHVLNAYGVTLHSMSESKQALLYYIESIHYRKLVGGTEGALDIAYNNIGFLYYKLSYYEKALGYYLMGLRVKEETNSTYDIDLLCNNIALCYCNLRRYDSAAYYAEKSLGYCREECRKDIKMHYHYAKAEIALALNDLDGAEQAFKASHAVAVEQGDERFRSEAMIGLATVANKKNSFKEALRYLDESIIHAKIGNFRLLFSKIYYQKAEVYHALNDFRNESLSRELYEQYHDSIFNETFANSLLADQVDFEQDRNRSLLTIRNASMDWQKKQHRFIILAGVLLILVISVLLWDIRSRQNENKFLEREVMIRTRELSDRVQLLTRSGAERSGWESKISQTVRGEIARLEGLCALLGATAWDRRVRGLVVSLRNSDNNQDNKDVQRDGTI